MSKLRFGWRFPTWPTDARTPMPTFQAQVDEHLKSLDGLFDSVWVSEHHGAARMGHVFAGDCAELFSRCQIGCQHLGKGGREPVGLRLTG